MRFAAQKNPTTKAGFFFTSLCSILVRSVLALHHVVHRYLVAAAEALAIVGLGAVGNMRMTILIPVVNVRSAVIVVVLAGTFDAIVKSLTLDVSKLLRGSIPIVVSIVIMRLGRGRIRRDSCKARC
jgi:hypothetical protein